MEIVMRNAMLGFQIGIENPYKFLQNSQNWKMRKLSIFLRQLSQSYLNQLTISHLEFSGLQQTSGQFIGNLFPPRNRQFSNTKCHFHGVGLFPFWSQESLMIVWKLLPNPVQCQMQIAFLFVLQIFFLPCFVGHIVSLFIFQL